MAKKSLIIWVIWLIAAAWCISLFIPGFSRVQELIAKNKELDREIESAKKDNKELSEEYEKLENDPVYIEKVAREKLGVAQKGEIVYKIP